MAVSTISPSMTDLPVVGLNPCSGKHKTRLLIGEGNFSFALALINKHDSKAAHLPDQSLAHSIIATELKSEIHCYECGLMQMFSNLEVSPTSRDKPKQPILCDKCTVTTKRIAELKTKGAKVRLGIDGTKLHEIEEFKNAKFTRIHWNCPHDGSSFKTQSLPPIILEFFKSCAKMQEPDDRVHITLAQPQGKKGFYQGYIYDIAQAATSASYVILKKRKFDQHRYPGYEHVMTVTNKTATITEQGTREFVFKKISLESVGKSVKAVKEKYESILLKPLIEQLMEYSEKKFTVTEEAFYKVPRDYFYCSTDEDSSDYES